MSTIFFPWPQIRNPPNINIGLYWLVYAVLLLLSLGIDVQPTVYMLNCLCGIGEEIKALFRTSQEALICQAAWAFDCCRGFVCCGCMTWFFAAFKPSQIMFSQSKRQYFDAVFTAAHLQSVTDLEGEESQWLGDWQSFGNWRNRDCKLNVSAVSSV